MLNKIFSMMFLLLTSSIAFQAMAERNVYPKLKPSDPPCLFLLDVNTGQPTGNPVNAPCELGSIAVKAGQTVSSSLRKQYGEVTIDGKTKIKKKPGRTTYSNITLEK